MSAGTRRLQDLRRVPYRRSKRSTRPAVSTIFMCPVKNGWLADEISTFTNGYSTPSSRVIVSLVSTVDRITKVAPSDRSWKTTGR